jgi:hypothetical protein
MDFFTVPTLRFSVLYGFFVISHDRRQILHFNVTEHPTSLWVVQQLREAFPFESSPRFLIFDRDGKYGAEVPDAVRSLRIRPVRTSFESPWQNGVAERWVESCRRDLLDHIIAVNERHLRRLLSDYVRYYHQDRTHLGRDCATEARRSTPPLRPSRLTSTMGPRIQPWVEVRFPLTAAMHPISGNTTHPVLARFQTAWFTREVWRIV